MLFHTETSASGNVYFERSSYEQAMRVYQAKKDSYHNYLRKIEFYKKFKVPADGAEHYFSSNWEKRVSWPALKQAGIELDNHLKRYRPEVKPDGIAYLNYFIIPGEKYLLIRIASLELPGAVFVAETYRFNDPGPPPVLKPHKSVRSSTVIRKKTAGKVIPNPPGTSPLGKELKKEKIEWFMMPDGNKYYRIQLVQNYPSLYFQSTLVRNFPQSALSCNGESK